MAAWIETLLTSVVRSQRTKDLDVVVVHLGKEDQAAERSWRTRWAKEDLRPNWIREWLSQDTESLGARLIDFRFIVEERHCSNLSYYIEAQANSLLSLMKERRRRVRKERPIVFIAQSIGGLVVTNALTRAAQVEDSISSTGKSIFSCTKMVIFLATPHPIIDTGKSEWRGRFIDSLSHFGRISKQSLRNNMNDEEFETLRLQADCYKSIEGKFRNVMIGDSRPDTERMPRKPLIFAHTPEATQSEHNNWSLFFGTVDFDTQPAGEESYNYMLSWVKKISGTSINLQQRLTLGKQASGLRSSSLSVSSERLYSEDDYKRLVSQSENQSLVAIETLIHLNNLARLCTKDDRFDEARWLYERIWITIKTVWESPTAPVDIDTLKDLLPMLRDVADLAGRQGRYSQGVTCLQASLRLSSKARACADLKPDICHVYADLGVLYSHNRQHVNAKRSFNHALKLAESCDMDSEFVQMVKLNRRSSDKLLAQRYTFELWVAIIFGCVSMCIAILFMISSVDDIIEHFPCLTQLQHFR